MPFSNAFGNFTKCECGLVVETDSWEESCLPVPLKKVDVHATIVNFVADVELLQVYYNAEDKPLEAVYLFPLDQAACLVGFEAELEGKIIQGAVKEIEAAIKEYGDAIQAGKTSYLITENKPDIFKIKVGMLQPNVTTSIKLRYLTELTVDGSAVRFYLPTTISPRYIPLSDNSQEAKDIASIPYSLSSPASMSIEVKLRMPSAILNIESPTHAINVDVHGRAGTASLNGETTCMDRDFVLLVHTENPHQPHICVEQFGDSTAAFVSLVPEFPDGVNQKVELVFLLDRSGSMGGKSIALAKRALKIFLYSLPTDIYFNIVGFGSSQEFLFPTSVMYTEKTFEKAAKHIEELDANLGGTEIYNPLKTILTQPSIEGYIRQVLVLTDGEVSNTDDIISLAQKHSDKARVFALGIGDGASHFLIDGIARAGSGTSEFASYNEQLEPKVLKQLSHCLKPALTDVSINWETNNDESIQKGIVAPFKVPPVFDKFHLLSYSIWESSKCIPSKVIIKACTLSGTITFSVDSHDSDTFQGDLIHKLAARKLIRDLQEGTSYLHGEEISEEQVKKEVVTIGCKYGLASKYTAFIAINNNEQENTKAVWGMQTRLVPNQLTHGWGSFESRQRIYDCASACIMSLDCSERVLERCTKMNSLESRAEYLQQGSSQFEKKARALKSKNRVPIFSSAISAITGASSALSSYFRRSSLDRKSVSLSNESAADTCSEDTSILDSLLELQKFDGHFEVNPQLGTIFGVNWDIIQADRGEIEEEVWVTALAIKFLEFVLSEEKETWQLVAKKSMVWLEHALDDAEPVINHAELFIKKYCLDLPFSKNGHPN